METITAKRAQLVAEGTVSNLAEQLKAMTKEQRRKVEAAEAAEELAEITREVVADRQREAAALAEAHGRATLGALMAAQTRERAAVTKLVEVAGSVLDDLVAGRLSRETIFALVTLDSTPMARQLLQTIECEVVMSAAQRQPQPAA